MKMKMKMKMKTNLKNKEEKGKSWRTAPRLVLIKPSVGSQIPGRKKTNGNHCLPVRSRSLTPNPESCREEKP
jgi:hypothetical protein